MQNDRWDALPDMSGESKNGPLLFVSHRILYSVDGQYRSRGGKLRELRWLDLKNISSRWSETKGLLPHSKYGPNTIARLGHTIYMIRARYPGKNEYSKLVWSLGTDGTHTFNDKIKTSAPMNVGRNEAFMCVTTDSDRFLWAIAGCKNCLDDGFVECFDVKYNRWVNVSGVPPNLTSIDKAADDIIAHGCGFSKGFIFVLFSSDYNSGLDRRFHIFDTVNNTWSVSDTKVKEQAYFPVVAVIEQTPSIGKTFIKSTASTESSSFTKGKICGWGIPNLHNIC